MPSGTSISMIWAYRFFSPIGPASRETPVSVTPVIAASVWANPKYDEP